MKTKNQRLFVEIAGALTLGLVTYFISRPSKEERELIKASKPAENLKSTGVSSEAKNTSRQSA